MLTKNVGLIEYSRKVDAANCITHGIGAVMAAVGFVFLVMRTSGIRSVASAVVFGLSLVVVYTVSAVYHGLPSGEAKRPRNFRRNGSLK